jgi:hypothetical protein
MPKLTDEDRKQLEALIESPDMGRDAAPLVRTLARIDELEITVVGAMADRRDALTRATETEADNAKLRADVEALLAMIGLMLEHVPLGMRDDAFVSEAMALRAKTAVKP